MDAILKKAIEKAGGATALAKSLNITTQAISQWKKVPASRVLQVEAATLGAVTRHELRPDVFGAAASQQQAA